mgnify:FL=1
MEILILLLIPGILILKIYFAKDDYQSLISLKKYKAKYPECKTEKGIKCFKCNSSSIKNIGYLGFEDDKRIFVCNHCGTWLYRNDDETLDLYLDSKDINAKTWSDNS